MWSLSGWSAARLGIFYKRLDSCLVGKIDIFAAGFKHASIIAPTFGKGFFLD